MGAGLGVSSCLTDFAGDWWGVRGSGKILLDTPGRTGDGFGKVGGGIGVLASVAGGGMVLGPTPLYVSQESMELRNDSLGASGSWGRRL